LSVISVPLSRAPAPSTRRFRPPDPYSQEECTFATTHAPPPRHTNSICRRALARLARLCRAAGGANTFAVNARSVTHYHNTVCRTIRKIGVHDATVNAHVLRLGTHTLNVCSRADALDRNVASITAYHASACDADTQASRACDADTRADCACDTNSPHARRIHARYRAA